ncbi:helix-turn-helix transcriptional regulator [Paenibacillus sediminis]|uniref:Transcriptional regulator with XRE-family HTH domain n=1 Tax=Paenibacillus sediminis TaxID=664909 RepID=A0ABS4H4G5_9BACL|nr:helix-turn-helix transcriptional regulator [Paenibacillus sediminis]MBP1937424.1 transcriptional regulator with XRE-family HTH domain [Paenibacillus sediminis]
MQSIYERIELLIEARNMTKKAFCEQLGISTGNLGDWKRGKSTPSTNKLVEIASFFNVSLDWLIIGRDPKAEIINDMKERYCPDAMKQLNIQNDDLSEQEIQFIREYIEFVKYRKRKGKLKEDDLN